MLSIDQVKTAVDFANRGHVDLNLQNIQDVLEAADFLGMESLIKGEFSSSFKTVLLNVIQDSCSL